MSTVESYREGAPCWVDLVTPDVDAARAFYGELFGWAYDAYPMPSEMGDATYYMSTIRGKNVAGLMQQPPQTADLPPTWHTYIAVDDADAAGVRVAEAGGSLLYPVDEIPGSGRTALAVDASGAKFGLWQAKGHIGSAVVNEPGAPLWHELQSSDPAAAVAFYSAVAGVEGRVSDMGDIEYTELIVDGKSVAGVMPKQSPDEPSVWLVYFGVSDPDDTVTLAESLGATVLAAPFSIEGVGRMAVVADPQGVVFAVMNGDS